MSKRIPAPIYTATDAINAHALTLPSPKRETLSSLQRQVVGLRININRIGMRLEKAKRLGHEDKVAKLEAIISRSVGQLVALNDGITARGGNTIHTPSVPVERTMPQGVRRHPERKPSAVRHVKPE